MSKPLHILFVCSWYPHAGDPGNGIFIKRHAECLATQHQVTVVFVKSSEQLTEEKTTITETGNLKEIICLYPKVRSNIPFLGPGLKFKTYRSRFESVLQKAFDNSSFDLVHLNVIFPAGIAVLSLLKKHKLPFVITEHWSGYYPEDGNYKGYLLRYVTKQIVAKAKVVLVISEKLKQAMLSHQLQSAYYLVNNVVDTKIFKPKASPVHDVLEILHVSSLVEREKNISGIIDIALSLKQKHKRFSLTVIGGTAESVEACKKIISENNLRDYVLFLGQKTASEIAEKMAESDVFLLFSHFEGMPVVLLEAMACGLPVISTNVGAVSTMVNSKYGVVLQSAKVEEAVREIEQYSRSHFEDPLGMHQYIEQQYGYAAVCEQLTGLYNRVLSEC